MQPKMKKGKDSAVSSPFAGAIWEKSGGDWNNI